MSDSPFVMFQISEHSDRTVNIQSFPAVITGRGMKPVLIGYKDWRADRDSPIVKKPVLSEPVEVLSLTVFVPGGFEFKTDIPPWRDEFGQLPGAFSYRAVGTDAPKVELGKPETDPSLRRPDPIDSRPESKPFFKGTV